MKVGDLFAKCSQLAEQEEKGASRIVGTMLPILAWLNEPVALRPGSLGPHFRESRSVTLQAGATVVMTDLQGNVSVRNLGEFKTPELLSILNGALPELKRMVADKRRADEVRPFLLLRTALGGSHLIVDTRSYRLSVANSGGDCIDLRVSVQLPGGGKTRRSRPCDVGRGKKAEVDLGVFKEVSGLRRLEVQVGCKDVDGRDLLGNEALSLGGADWQEAKLRRKS